VEGTYVGYVGCEPVEGSEPVEDQGADEMVQKPEIAELCNVVACKQ